LSPASSVAQVLQTPVSSLLYKSVKPRHHAAMLADTLIELIAGVIRTLLIEELVKLVRSGKVQMKCVRRTDKPVTPDLAQIQPPVSGAGVGGAVFACCRLSETFFKYFSAHERWTYSWRTRNHWSSSLIGS